MEIDHSKHTQVGCELGRECFLALNCNPLGCYNHVNGRDGMVKRKIGVEWWDEIAKLIEKDCVKLSYLIKHYACDLLYLFKIQLI